MSSLTPHRRARAEGQRKRIIELLEKATESESKNQCPKCGQYFESVGLHSPHCDGPQNN